MAVAGVMQLTAISWFAVSFPNDLVNPITAALEAEYAGAFGLPSLPAIDAILIIPHTLFHAFFLLHICYSKKHRSHLHQKP